MRRLKINWLMISLKENLKSLSFYLMVLLLTFAFWTEKAVVGEYNSDVEVLVCSGETELGKAVTQELVSSSPDGFTFIEEDDTDRLIKMVKTGKVSCGVLFTDDEEKPVTLYQSPDSTNGYVVKEIIFPIMQRCGAGDWMESYLDGMTSFSEEGEIIPSEEAKNYVEEKYADYLENTKINIYELNTASTDDNASAEENENTGGSENPNTASNRKTAGAMHRNLFIILILITAALCAYDTLGTDRGFYGAFDKKTGVLLKAEKIIATLAMAIVPALLISSILATGL